MQLNPIDPDIRMLIQCPKCAYLQGLLLSADPGQPVLVWSDLVGQTLRHTCAWPGCSQEMEIKPQAGPKRIASCCAVGDDDADYRPRLDVHQPEAGEFMSPHDSI